MTISRMNSQSFSSLYDSGTESSKFELFNLINDLVDQTSVLTGAVVPTFEARQHQWYLDTATNKYYRNVDGGTTWVALN